MGYSNGNEEIIANAAESSILNLDDSTRWDAAMNTLV